LFLFKDIFLLAFIKRNDILSEGNNDLPSFNKKNIILLKYNILL